MFDEDTLAEGEGTDPTPTEQQVPQGTESTTVPEDDPIEAAIERRLVRERAIQERKLKKLFGTKDLQEAASLAEAGRAVSNAAGVPPRTVVDRVRNQYQPRGTAQQPDDIKQQLEEIRELIATERAEKSRATQAAEAKQEFGSLYDKYADDIALVAEEKDLSLADAAAITLRPYLKNHYAQQVQARRQAAAQRKVDDSNDPPVDSGIDVDSILTPNQKYVAKKMGLTSKEYYAQLKALGKAPQ